MALGIGLLGAGTAGAQGFGIYEYSACQMAMGGAGVAAPCNDGSANFYNPAAIAWDGRLLGFTGVIISPRGGFTQDVTGATSDLKDRNIPVPALYYVQPIGKSLAFGLAFGAPYGLSTEWPSDALGRFLGYKSKVEGIYIQPTIAWKVGDRFALGFGLDLTQTRLELKQHADLYYVPIPGTPFTFGTIPGGVPKGTDFADIQLKGDSMQIGYHVGALIKPSKMFSVGLRYLSRQESKVDDGTIDTTQIMTGRSLPAFLPPPLGGASVDALVAPQFTVGRLQDQSAQARGVCEGTDCKGVPLPDQFVIGIAVMPTEQFKVMFDYQWVHWSLFEQLNVIGDAGLTEVVWEKYEDTNGYRFGAEYAVKKGLAIRGGFVAHNAAAPDVTVTPNLPEAARKLYTVGVGAFIGKGFTLDIGYNYLQQDDRRGRSTNCGQEQPTTACNDGLYEFHANLLGASLTWKF
jgi:long-chain fatty acid transport protein